MRPLRSTAMLLSQAFAEIYKPDAENGAFLHGDHCVECHMVDSHEAFYTKENRVVMNGSALLPVSALASKS